MVLWRRRKVVSFLVSGKGLIFSVVAKKIIKGEIKARTGYVVTDNASAQVLTRARGVEVPASFVSWTSQPEESAAVWSQNNRLYRSFH